MTDTMSRPLMLERSGAMMMQQRLLYGNTADGLAREGFGAGLMGAEMLNIEM